MIATREVRILQASVGICLATQWLSQAFIVATTNAYRGLIKRHRETACGPYCEM